MDFKETDKLDPSANHSVRLTPQQAAEHEAERAQRNMAERLAKMKRGEPVRER